MELVKLRKANSYDTVAVAKKDGFKKSNADTNGDDCSTDVKVSTWDRRSAYTLR